MGSNSQQHVVTCREGYVSHRKHSCPLLTEFRLSACQLHRKSHFKPPGTIHLGFLALITQKHLVSGKTFLWMFDLEWHVATCCCQYSPSKPVSKPFKGSHPDTRANYYWICSPFFEDAFFPHPSDASPEQPYLPYSPPPSSVFLCF